MNSGTNQRPLLDNTNVLLTVQGVNTFLGAVVVTHALDRAVIRIRKRLIDGHDATPKTSVREAVMLVHPPGLEPGTH